ncbi:M15 family metallopeptidase [Conexibacter woesei]|uniref:Peptidase M15B and M15C DD-carboxypeptidase VanY/endolysin n=1 Tax=Conexibacter woesei (strain DSM 14684 / CCUG 47730 / CIP 108061 / JCM 11494 / NBRC 100937 / ID131577) TaxID=469383 RepID=D3FA76_CONWI|nr:M15 family metallopeptidase [Conexibacter woesei]ADB53171.1 peptidase M15B and M15C DD-carboxypeptidase VanY/endolysin [Conexibacter woesei DSM 14684]
MRTVVTLLSVLALLAAARARAPLLPVPLAPELPAAQESHRQATRAALDAAARERADVLVDKRRGLPARYRPRDLVAPRVRFLAGVDGDARLLRRGAARGLERMFAAARRDGVRLAGVSGFRSFASQRALFAGYADARGVENAAHVSARAGHSEHQTGLAIDIAGADGRCAASGCFAGTRAARWLERHAAAHGFVVRYPRGKEDVTGYAYEPWHLRYVGVALATEAAASGRTLDELLRTRRG